MPELRRFVQVDVFTAVPLKGNALAVVVDAGGLSDDEMAAFARWTNLSETTFLLPPTEEGSAEGADYRVRIFTPGGELPFAGHPTLGSAYAFLASGGDAKKPGEVVQQCAIGLVRVKRDGARLAFAAPPLKRSGPVDAATRAQAIASLRVAPDAVLDVVWCDNGPGWLAVRLADAASVLALQPDFAVMDQLKVGALGAYPDGSECQFEVRAFVPDLGVPEDPVTGSLNAGLALWLQAAGLAGDRYVAAQGAVLGRAGRVHVQRDAEATWIGGDVVPLIHGQVRL
jgi:PhzF family phenazine biosynthesis protein